ncbi:MAG: hypothetical protein HY706_13855 [Candidatus Hydrogenedentes bacterium]|nr:hypothetical protein [Candidatus Hydrogenedentota bacterium]
MKRQERSSAAEQSVDNRPLPKRLQAFFWQYDFPALRLKRDLELVVSQILQVGDWGSIKWLRRRVGDEVVREWILRRRGAGLSPQQLRYWELILKLPREEVNAWLAEPHRQVWDRRARR